MNGKLVKKHVLKNGHIISIGRHELKYVNEEASTEDDFKKTLVIRPEMAGHTAAKAVTATAPKKAIRSND